MIIEWLYELKESIDKHGIRLGVVLTLFVVYRKELRNKRLDLRDEAMFQNQRIIMDHLGIGSQFLGQPVVSHRDLANYKPLQQYYSAVISRGEYLLRRTKRMNQTINFSVLFLAIAGVIKLILQPFGIDLTGVTDDQINGIANGLSAIFTIVGIIRNNVHKKGVVDNGSVIPTEDNR